jgi:PPP family 3-phenylpropionic acid transporter
VNKQFKKFRVFMFLYWAMMLSVSGMYTMYLTQLGFSKQEISKVVTIYTLASLLGQIFIGYLVDKFGKVNKIMFSFICTGIVVGSFITHTKTHWILYLLLFIWGFCVYGTVPLSEAWCIEMLNATHEQKNFGKIRGLGSIGYGLSGPFLGFLLERFGWNIYSWYIIISVICTLTVVYSMINRRGIKSAEKDTALRKASNNISLKEGLIEIFKIKPLFIMVAIIFMYLFVVKGVYNYLGVLLADFGGGPLSLGFTYFFDATPEIVTFFLTARLLKKYRGKTLIFAGVILQIIRFIVIIIFNNAIAVILMGTLSGFAFGLVATSYKTYIYELAPEKYKASCMSISETIIGLSGIISAPIFGFMFTNLGTNMTMVVGLIIYILLMLLLLRDILYSKKSVVKAVR